MPRRHSQPGSTRDLVSPSNSTPTAYCGTAVKATGAWTTGNLPARMTRIQDALSRLYGYSFHTRTTSNRANK